MAFCAVFSTIHLPSLFMDHFNGTEHPKEPRGKMGWMPIFQSSEKVVEYMGLKR